MDEPQKRNNVWDLYFLSWLDALEKLELLQLEIKHLQVNCIYSLRSGHLLSLLDSEEALFLKGQQSRRTESRFFPLPPQFETGKGEETLGLHLLNFAYTQTCRLLPNYPSVTDYEEALILERFLELKENALVFEGDGKDGKPIRYCFQLGASQDARDLAEELKSTGGENATGHLSLESDKDHPEKTYLKLASPTFEGLDRKTLIASVQVAKQVYHLWTSGVWGNARKDLYRMLQAAQHLKQQVVADRLTFFYQGCIALNMENPGEYQLDPSKINQRSGPWLFWLRSGILERADHGLELLENLQRRLAQQLESFPPEYPHQTIHRRREQGVYTHFLTQRVRDLRRNMNLQIDFFRAWNACEDKDNVSKAMRKVMNELKPMLEQPTILHRWDHKHSSYQAVQLDDHKAWNKLTPRAEYIQTSFWMLDKPDSQVILAHEVAHHAIRQNYNNFNSFRFVSNSAALRDSNDPFESLIFALERGIQDWVTTEGGGDDGPSRRGIDFVDAREIAADLLAALNEGHAYLYSFLIEGVGRSLPTQMAEPFGYVPHLRVNLQLISDPPDPQTRKTTLIQLSQPERTWYLRGMVLLAWMGQIFDLEERAGKNVGGDLFLLAKELGCGNFPDQNTRLESDLHGGVDAILNELNQFLDARYTELYPCQDLLRMYRDEFRKETGQQEEEQGTSGRDQAEEIAFQHRGRQRFNKDFMFKYEGDQRRVLFGPYQKQLAKRILSAFRKSFGRREHRENRNKFINFIWNNLIIELGLVLDFILDNIKEINANAERDVVEKQLAAIINKARVDPKRVFRRFELSRLCKLCITDKGVSHEKIHDQLNSYFSEVSNDFNTLTKDVLNRMLNGGDVQENEGRILQDRALFSLIILHRHPPEPPLGAEYRRLADRLQNIVKEVVPNAAKYASLWHQYQQEEQRSSENSRLFFKNTHFLPEEFRQFLIDALFWDRVRHTYQRHGVSGFVGDDGKPLDNSTLWTRHRENFFQDRFQLDDSGVGIGQDRLFQKVQDIPYQASMLRARDFFKLPGEILKDKSPKRWDHQRIYNEILTNTALGRRLFFLAMEVSLNLSQPSRIRLVAVQRLLNKARNYWDSLVEDKNEGKLGDPIASFSRFEASREMVRVWLENTDRLLLEQANSGTRVSGVQYLELDGRIKDHLKQFLVPFRMPEPEHFHVDFDLLAHFIPGLYQPKYSTDDTPSAVPGKRLYCYKMNDDSDNKDGGGAEREEPPRIDQKEYEKFYFSVELLVYLLRIHGDLPDDMLKNEGRCEGNSEYLQSHFWTRILNQNARDCEIKGNRSNGEESSADCRLMGRDEISKEHQEVKIQFDMVSRIRCSGTQEAPMYGRGDLELPHFLAYVTGFREGREQIVVEEKGSSDLEPASVERHLPLLGNFDALMFREDERMICRCVIPDFAGIARANYASWLVEAAQKETESGSKDAADFLKPWDKNQREGFCDSIQEVSIPHFVRREMWIPIQLRPHRDWQRTHQDADHAKEAPKRREPILGILFIRLVNRFLRMDFLSCLDGHLHRFGCSSLDRVFLVDGWADCAILLSEKHFADSRRKKSDGYYGEKPGTETDRKLSDINRLVEQLFQHIMVERTELSLTTRCINRMILPRENGGQEEEPKLVDFSPFQDWVNLGISHVEPNKIQLTMRLSVGRKNEFPLYKLRKWLVYKGSEKYSEWSKRLKISHVVMQLGYMDLTVTLTFNQLGKRNDLNYEEVVHFLTQPSPMPKGAPKETDQAQDGVVKFGHYIDRLDIHLGYD